MKTRKQELQELESGVAALYDQRDATTNPGRRARIQAKIDGPTKPAG